MKRNNHRTKRTQSASDTFTFFKSVFFKLKLFVGNATTFVAYEREHIFFHIDCFFLNCCCWLLFYFLRVVCVFFSVSIPIYEAAHISSNECIFNFYSKYESSCMALACQAFAFSFARLFTRTHAWLIQIHSFK